MKKENRRTILKLCAALWLFKGTAQRKNKWECLGYLGPSRRPTAISTQPKRVRGPQHHIEAAVGAVSRIHFMFNFASIFDALPR